ncbi:MAG: hypothetical protein AB7H93_23530 [Vicinamibacterales bacterium]
MTGLVPLVLVALLHGWAAADAGCNGRWALAVVLAGYTLADLGAVWLYHRGGL